ISQLLLHRDMKVYSDINSLPHFPNAVITTGSFDGVHSGHVLILEQLVKEAEEKNGTPVVITFFPHPKQVVQIKDKPLHILNTPGEKYELLHSKGIKNIVVVPFDKSFAELSAQDYIEQFLVKRFDPAVIVVGYDHRFGNNRDGDYNLLKKAGAAFNFEVKEIPEHVLKNITISSTKIREAMLAGDIKTAAEYLGYDYFFSGTVVEGNKLGRTIGYPTANLQIEDENKLVPANGVYAVDVELNHRSLKGMMNIGVRPTVNGTKRVTEVNLFDFDEEIYGQSLKITLKQWLRSEVKFSGLDELKAQLGRDKEEAMKVNK
ncbi:MAG: bifunctional riboflavin kinase/FAD synthetase, partial [Ferruginibacter sp.]